MAEDAPQERRELCRREVRRYLAERPVLAYRAATLRERLNANKEGDWQLHEIEIALNFLLGLKFVTALVDSMGATKGWQITSEGVLAHEREAA